MAASTSSQTVSVFESVGTSLDAGLCTAVVGGTQLLATAASILLVDRAGRRPLLLASCALTGLAMASLATFLQVVASSSSSSSCPPTSSPPYFSSSCPPTSPPPVLLLLLLLSSYFSS